MSFNEDTPVEVKEEAPPSPTHYEDEDPGYSEEEEISSEEDEVKHEIHSEEEEEEIIIHVEEECTSCFPPILEFFKFQLYNIFN